MNLDKAPASIGSSCAGLCKRGRQGRFRCGDHGVRNIAFNASGTRRSGYWRRPRTEAFVCLFSRCIMCELTPACLIGPRHHR